MKSITKIYTIYQIHIGCNKKYTNNQFAIANIAGYGKLIIGIILLLHEHKVKNSKVDYS